MVSVIINMNKTKLTQTITKVTICDLKTRKVKVNVTEKGGRLGDAFKGYKQAKTVSAIINMNVTKI